MLYPTGYLTKAKEQPNNGNTALVIPNREVQMVFIDKVLSWFEDFLKLRDLQLLEHGFLTGLLHGAGLNVRFNDE